MVASSPAAADPRPLGPHEVAPPADDLLGLARCLAADASALAKTELRRQEVRAERFAGRATYAASIALIGATVGLVGWVALSLAGVLALEAAGIPRAGSLALVGAAELTLATLLGRAAAAVLGRRDHTEGSRS